MGANWQQAAFNECIDTLIDYRGKTPRKTTSGVPLITAKVVKSGRIETPNEFIAEEDYEGWMRRGMPQPGDVVVTTEAPLGEVAQLGAGRVALAQRLIGLRGKAGVLDNTFLKFLMQSDVMQEQLRARATGTTVLGIKQSQIRKLTFPLPPVAEQRQIARILGGLDDKIELNRRTNETLESIADALFERCANAAPQTRVRFPEAIDFQEGPGIMAVDFRPAGVPLIRLAGLTDGLSLLTGCNYLDPKMVKQRWGHFRLRQGDVLLSTSASLGRVATVTTEAEGAIPYTGIIRMRPRDSAILPEVIRMLLRSRSFQEQVEAVGAGSVLRHFGPSHLRTMHLSIPSTDAQQAFAWVTRPIFAKYVHNLSESRSLAALRDTLLPKLLSGEIRVGAVEEEIAKLA